MQAEQENLRPILRRYSLELTARDEKAFTAVVDLLPRGSEVFVADLPHQEPELLIGASVRIRAAGFHPVPHLVARNIPDFARLESLLSRLCADAKVDRALILGGDRDEPVGDYEKALDLIDTGLLQQHGIRTIVLAMFPEGHPKIGEEELRSALCAKVDAAQRAGHELLLVSQFVFEAQPLVDAARRLRADGISAPLRAGVAGPADRKTLLDFGSDLGVGESMRIVEEHAAAAGSLAAEESPAKLLRDLEKAQASEPSLLIEGIHFFAFGSTAKAISWAQRHQFG